MLIAGDGDIFKVLMDYEMNQRIFLEQRTQLYWNHSGHWTPETATLFGAYDSPTNGGKGWPIWLNTNPYIRLDWGGDSGTGEMAIMAMDYFNWVGDAQYLPLAYSVADFYMGHFNNRSEDGRVLVWPAQVLETFWCDFNTSTASFENCCSNDAPTVSAMHALFDKLLALPPTVTTPAQRTQWAAFSQILPILAVNASSNVILPAAQVSSGRHNSEGPEFYPMHPHRMFTKGRQVASNTSIELGISTYLQSPWRGANSGWNYALNAAVLLGLTQQAVPMLLARASTPPAAGYRFPGYAPHEQDFDPSSDRKFLMGCSLSPTLPQLANLPALHTFNILVMHLDFANMNRALQEMLLQSGEDGFEDTKVVLLPAWPCAWDVHFRLVGPLNTTVEVAYVGGKVVSLTVEPPSRSSAVVWGGCMTA